MITGYSQLQVSCTHDHWWVVVTWCHPWRNETLQKAYVMWWSSTSFWEALLCVYHLCYWRSRKQAANLDSSVCCFHPPPRTSSHLQSSCVHTSQNQWEQVSCIKRVCGIPNQRHDIPLQMLLPFTNQRSTRLIVTKYFDAFLKNFCSTLQPWFSC